MVTEMGMGETEDIKGEKEKRKKKKNTERKQLCERREKKSFGGVAITAISFVLIQPFLLSNSFP